MVGGTPSQIKLARKCAPQQVRESRSQSAETNAVPYKDKDPTDEVKVTLQRECVIKAFTFPFVGIDLGLEGRLARRCQRPGMWKGKLSFRARAPHQVPLLSCWVKKESCGCLGCLGSCCKLNSFTLLRQVEGHGVGDLKENDAVPRTSSEISSLANEPSNERSTQDQSPTGLAS